MARFSVLSHETNPSFEQLPGKGRVWLIYITVTIVTSTATRAACQSRRMVQPGSLCGHGSQVGGLPAQVAVYVCSQEPDDSWGHAPHEPRSLRGDGPQSEQRSIRCGASCDRPRRPLPRLARLFKSRYRGLELQTARIQSEGHQCENPSVGRADEGEQLVQDKATLTHDLAERTSSRILCTGDDRGACSHQRVLVRVPMYASKHVREQKWRRSIVTPVDRGKIAGVIIPGPDREGDGQIMGSGQGEARSSQTGKLTR